VVSSLEAFYSSLCTVRVPSEMLIQFKTLQFGVAIQLQTCIQISTGLSDILTRMFRDFPRFLQANIRVVSLRRE